MSKGKVKKKERKYKKGNIRTKLESWKNHNGPDKEVPNKRIVNIWISSVNPL